MRCGPRTLLGAMVVVAQTLAGCCDECVPDTQIVLPMLTSEVSQTVTVRFANAPGGTPKVTCTWESGPEIAKGDWSCVPPPADVGMDGTVRQRLEYHFRGETHWFVQGTGPSGSTEFENPAVSTDPGEGWPGSCPCYPDELEVNEDALSAVGARFQPPAPPTFGSACSMDSDCDPTLSCESSPATGVQRCTRTCSTRQDCPEGSFCNSGRCELSSP